MEETSIGNATHQSESAASESRVYNMQSDLSILNEIPHAVWICNFESADTRFLWGNTACIHLWNKPSLTALVSTDIMSGRSIAVQKLHQKLFQDVQVQFARITTDDKMITLTLSSQVERKSVVQRRTLYPNGNSVVIDIECRPICLKLSDSAEPRTMVLVIGNPLDLKVFVIILSENRLPVYF